MQSGASTDTGRVIAVVPTHDEVRELPLAIAALRAQTRPPDRILVVVNNPRGGIERVARATGAEVEVLPHCPELKAGALNHVLDHLMPQLRPNDWVLVQDADSYLDPEFIRSGLAADAPDVGGIGGVFRGRIDAPRRSSRLLQCLQANEYARYELDIRRQRGRVLVLTGTATLLRAGVLRDVVDARRDGRLPAGAGKVYDTKVLTEDNELSFALMHLGYRIVSPRGCTLTTETMPTMRTLAAQRCRWKRGALENLFDYGLTRHTAPYWGRQLLALLGVLVAVGYVGSLIYGLAVGWQLHMLWVGVSVLFAVERMVTVRRRGWRMVLIAATLVIETAYDLILQAVQLRAFAAAATRTRQAW